MSIIFWDVILFFDGIYRIDWIFIWSKKAREARLFLTFGSAVTVSLLIRINMVYALQRGRASEPAFPRRAWERVKFPLNKGKKRGMSFPT